MTPPVAPHRKELAPTASMSRYWLSAAFALGFLAVGNSHWRLAYSQVSLPHTLMGPGLLLVGLSAFLSRAVGKSRLLATILIVGASVPTAVFARVAFDVAKDGTSHNLWPFELVIAAAVGLLASLVGTLLGSVPAWLTSMGTRNSPQRPEV